jgi:hypothetical protein
MAFKALDNPTVDKPWLKTVRDVTNNIMRGKINATVDITLGASVSTTTMLHPLLSGSSYIGFMPQSADAAAATPIYVTGRGNGTATLHHNATSTTACVFTALIIG